jgi:hypothetical protein
MKVAVFRVVTLYKKTEKIVLRNVVLKIAICLLCGLFTQAKCFLFTDGVLAEYEMYYN